MYFFQNRQGFQKKINDGLFSFFAPSGPLIVTRVDFAKLIAKIFYFNFCVGL